MFKSTEISTFIFPDYVFSLVLNVISSLLFLSSLSVCPNLSLLLPPLASAFLMLEAEHSSQKPKSKMTELGPGRKLYGQKPHAWVNVVWKNKVRLIWISPSSWIKITELYNHHSSDHSIHAAFLKGQRRLTTYSVRLETKLTSKWHLEMLENRCRRAKS